ncbi:hypothetical protein EDD85DRAFT_790999 [Armillaria nabsnona]|nr:hypothetical protein EDD85DRAFT_790999 [Armillaria nabsnona]
MWTYYLLQVGTLLFAKFLRNADCFLQQLSLRMASPKQNVTTPTIAELKKALKLLKDETDQRRKDIKTWLAQKKPVSREDEEWLDEAGNLVDEVVLVESLAAAPDLHAALTNLNEHQKDVYALLIGKIWPSISKKRKCPEAKQTATNDGKARARQRSHHSL